MRYDVLTDKFIETLHPVNLEKNIIFKPEKKTTKSLKILVFGRVRYDKDLYFLFNNLPFLQKNFPNIEIQIVGKFISNDYYLDILNKYNNLPPHLKKCIYLDNNFIEEDQKNILYEMSDVILLPYIKGEFAQVMHSGIIYDAISYSKPVLYTNILNSTLNIGESFNINDINDFSIKLKKIIKDYNNYTENLMNIKNHYKKQFKKELDEIFQ